MLLDNYKGIEVFDVKTINDGAQFIFRCSNNYGASVVRHGFSYGNSEGLWELAVIRFNEDGDWYLDYSTPITDDVIGWLTEEKVRDIIIKISELKEE